MREPRVNCRQAIANAGSPISVYHFEYRLNWISINLRELLSRENLRALAILPIQPECPWAAGLFVVLDGRESCGFHAPQSYTRFFWSFGFFQALGMLHWTEKLRQC